MKHHIDTTIAVRAYIVVPKNKEIADMELLNELMHKRLNSQIKKYFKENNINLEEQYGKYFGGFSTVMSPDKQTIAYIVNTFFGADISDLESKHSVIKEILDATMKNIWTSSVKKCLGPLTIEGETDE